MNHDAKTRLLALLMILCLILTNSLTSVYANNNTIVK